MKRVLTCFLMTGGLSRNFPLRQNKLIPQSLTVSIGEWYSNCRVKPRFKSASQQDHNRNICQYTLVTNAESHCF